MSSPSNPETYCPYASFIPLKILIRLIVIIAIGNFPSSTLMSASP